MLGCGFTPTVRLCLHYIRRPRHCRMDPACYGHWRLVWRCWHNWMHHSLGSCGVQSPGVASCHMRVRRGASTAAQGVATWCSRRKAVRITGSWRHLEYQRSPRGRHGACGPRRLWASERLRPGRYLCICRRDAGNRFAQGAGAGSMFKAGQAPARRIISSCPQARGTGAVTARAV